MSLWSAPQSTTGGGGKGPDKKELRFHDFTGTRHTQTQTHAHTLNMSSIAPYITLLPTKLARCNVRWDYIGIRRDKTRCVYVCGSHTGAGNDSGGSDYESDAESHTSPAEVALKTALEQLETIKLDTRLTQVCTRMRVCVCVCTWPLGIKLDTRLTQVRFLLFS